MARQPKKAVAKGAGKPRKERFAPLSDTAAAVFLRACTAPRRDPVALLPRSMPDALFEAAKRADFNAQVGMRQFGATEADVDRYHGSQYELELKPRLKPLLAAIRSRRNHARPVGARLEDDEG